MGIKRFGVGFKIKMGFGMHVGWAVEGAIGSELKIDATYLSPHVEMSDRLEAASKIFGAKLNMSHWFVNLCTPTFRKHIRAIDCIKVEGVSVPLTVMTFERQRASTRRSGVFFLLLVECGQLAGQLTHPHTPDSR